MDLLEGESLFDYRGRIIPFLVQTFCLFEWHQHVAVFLAMVVHDQVVRDTIEPGPKGHACGTIVGQFFYHARENLASQILGRLLVADA